MTLKKLPATQPKTIARWRAALIAVSLAVAAGITISGAANEHRASLSDDLATLVTRGSAVRTRVIVSGTRAEIEALAAEHHLRIVRWLRGGAVVLANGKEIGALAANEAVNHLSGDPVVRTSMSVSNKSTAADQVRAGTSGLLGIGGIPGVTGQGIGVAVVDSGISPHKAFAKRVVANVSHVTGDPSTADAYGHGTHVAGIIAGGATSVTSLYTGGVAPGANLINVRVLGALGFGYTSDVIAGIDWVIENRSRYNIRVMNLSLGHPVMEPSTTDPLCQAVARAVAAGIVVVVSAGNDGRSDTGVPILGGITSPGNSPLAVTVGALNTWSTVSRSDDSVAPYSSRGPTKFEFVVKPDIAAPGTRIVSLEADGSYLSQTYPFLHTAGGGDNGYMQLSGTSMAAPIVSGGVALLLQGAPSLSTGHVKLALQSGATFVPDGGLMGAGAGSVNFANSRQIAANGLSAVVSNLLTTLVGGVLAPASGASFWDAGTLAHRVHSGEGLRLLSSLDLSRIWAKPSLLKWGDLNLAGLLNPLRNIPGNDLIWGEVASWAKNDEIIWGTDDEIIWGTDDEIIWGTDDEIIWGTRIHDPHGQEIIWGTSGDDEIIWGTNDVLTSPDPR